MTLLLETVRNLTVYLIFITVIKNLLGDSSYGKYVEFVMGIIMILIVIGPVGKALNMEGVLEPYFNFQETNFEIKDAKNEIYEGEEKVNEEILKKAEEQLKEQMQNLAAEKGICITKSEILLSKEEESFGSIEQIALWLSYDKEENKVQKIVVGKTKETEKFSKFAKKISEVYGVKEESIYIYEA